METVNEDLKLGFKTGIVLLFSRNLDEKALFYQTPVIARQHDVTSVLFRVKKQIIDFAVSYKTHCPAYHSEACDTLALFIDIQG